MTHQEFIDKVMGLCRGEFDPSLAGAVALELIAHDKEMREWLDDARSSASYWE